MFLEIDEETRQDLEIVDGYVVPREQRGGVHQKVGTRLSIALEQGATVRMRETGNAECYETNTEVDVLLWEVPATARKPDAVLHRCLPRFQQLSARQVLIVVEVVSRHSMRRDRAHKMGDYADAGIPHYWLVEFDEVGMLSLDRYALVGDGQGYTKIGTSQRDMGADAVNVTSPFPIRIDWDQLAVAPPE